MTWRLLALALLATAGCARVEAQGVPGDFVVTMSRTRCFGICPVYSVSVDARGNVSYQGDDFVRVSGHRTSKIALDRVSQLATAVEQIGFFDLQSQYQELKNADGTSTFVTDLPTTYVTVTSNGRRKRVEDYFGTPKPLLEFERLVDEVTNTRQWIRIDPAGLREMFKSASPPSAEGQLKFLSDAIGYDDIDVIQVLLDRGLDPNRRYLDYPLLHLARSPQAVRVLKQAGADVTARTNDGNALSQATEFGPELTQALLEVGVPADVPSNNGWTPLLRASCRGNAGVVALLLAAGANPETRTKDNKSALECAQEELRSSGSRRRDEFGLFKEDYEAVVRLLEAAIAKRKP